MVTKKPQSPASPSIAVPEGFVVLPEGGAIEQPVPDAAMSESAAQPEPPRSFFRGVAVGIAIMIPVWAWLLLRLVR
jgi:hypothetical protein